MAKNAAELKKQAFANLYAISGNGAQSAIGAGYAPHSATVTASRLLKDAKVRLMIDEAQRRQQEAATISLARIAEELAAIGFAEVGEPVKLSHKLKALELLTKHLTLEELEKRLHALEQALAERNGHAVY
jgi:phage terminase small subunit